MRKLGCTKVQLTVILATLHVKQNGIDLTKIGLSLVNKWDEI